MSKKILAVIMALAILVMAAGCSEERGPSYIEGCVTQLGQYKGLTVTVTNDDVQARMIDTYHEKVNYDVATEGAIGEEAVLIMDCTATKGGEAVDSLSYPEQVYSLGKSEPLPGFDAALVGHELGEEFAFSLDVPSDYGDEALAGQKVDFTVKAASSLIYPEMNDENVYNFLGEELGVQTLSEFRGYCRETIYAERLIDMIVSGTTVDHVINDDYKDYKDYYYKEYHGDYEERAADDYTGSYDDYCLEFQGKSAAELDAEVEEGAQDYALKRVIIYAVCEAEGIEASDEIIQSYAVNAFTEAGYATPKSFIKAMGRERLRYELTLSSLETFYNYILGANTCEE